MLLFHTGVVRDTADTSKLETGEEIVISYGPRSASGSFNRKSGLFILSSRHVGTHRTCPRLSQLHEWRYKFDINASLLKSKHIACCQNHHFSRSNALINPPSAASFRVGLKNHHVHWYTTAGRSHFHRGRVALGA